MSLRFEIILTVEIDESAHFLEVDKDNELEVVKEKIGPRTIHYVPKIQK